MMRSLAGLLLICLLSGCAALPSSGPSSADIAPRSGALNVATRDYVLLTLDAKVAQVMGPVPTPSIDDIFGQGTGRSSNGTLGVGDKLLITVWEAASDGLFSTMTGKQTPIEVTVDQSRGIFVPYAGRIDVDGLNVEAVRQAVARRLEGKAIDPQVQVSLVEGESQKLTIVGDVTSPGQYPIPSGGLRLIDAVALAGGAKAPSFETELTILRGDTRAVLPLDRVLSSAGNNIQLGSGDVVEVRTHIRSFTAFGAVSAQNLQPFKSEQVSLAEALAQSGGLNDNLADTGGVFLFRYETAQRLSDLDQGLPVGLDPQRTPTIYQLDLGAPQTFFLASRFMMQDKDILYVANAPATELQKFTRTILAPLIGSAQSVNALNDSL